MLQLFDTAKGAVAPVQLREPGKVSMYVCGPTVYGPPHLGHGRFSLVFDVLRRYLTWSGLDVTYVSNITDIDDKIIQRAQNEDRDWRDITQRCEAVWYRAMDALNVARPDHDPHATAYVEQMVALIGRLVERGAAYETSDGVYFLSETVDDYGLLDSGSVFMAFCRDLDRQFATVKRRTHGQDLDEYMVAFGGGYFFCPPGIEGDGDYLARRLVERS